MRVIVFDRELHEPLTVVQVPQWLADEAKTGRPIRLAAPPKPPLAVNYADAAERPCTTQVVTLTFERVCRGDSRTGMETLFWYAYADDPDTALLLRAAFLPGQVGEVQRREKAAYFMGLLT